MGKAKFDVNATAMKFLSETKRESTEQFEDLKIRSDEFIPEVKEEKRPKGKDKQTGEVTKQMGFYITEEQDEELQRLARKFKTNKSAILREAIKMYFKYLEREGI